MNNNSYNVFEKIKKTDRKKWHLYVDAVYKANPVITNMGAEVLSKLVGVKNQGGIRYLGPTEKPKLVVLYSTGEDIYWQDSIETSLGVYTYYGDNKTSGNELHSTDIHGNEILRYVFDLAAQEDDDKRMEIPPILLFKKTQGWDRRFLGLAVPGVKGKPVKEWLTAVWGCDENGHRFQNYKALFTILDTKNEKDGYDSGINLAWLNDIGDGNAYKSRYAPDSWKRYVKKNDRTPLLAKVHKFKIKKEDQLPRDPTQISMLETLHDFFIAKDRGYSFEKFAADIIENFDDAVDQIKTTRPYKDGGFDAEGRYKIFKSVENSIFVDFYVQAKCYQMSNAVNVADTARLISRIKNRQFGIMITTSYIGDTAFKEVIADKHPIVFITGKDIIEYI